MAEDRCGLAQPRGRVWGGHELLAPLARGGMAELFVARPAGSTVQRQVALKRMLPRFRDDAEIRRQFENEVSVTSALQHPSLPHLYAAGYEDDEPFFTMELLQGETLLEVLRRGARHDQPIPFDVAIFIAARLASALHHAHEARDPLGNSLGIVHRDVSPGNVIVRSDGQVCLIDFGVARNTTVAITAVGTVKGKLAYMSPEQCWGHRVDRRSDIFSLGILMYEMTTGRRLFRGGEMLGTITQVMRGELRPPSEQRPLYPPELESIVMRALRPTPEERFPTALQLQYELERAASRAGMWLSELRVMAYAAHLRALGRARPTRKGVRPKFRTVRGPATPQPPPPEQPNASSPRRGSSGRAALLLVLGGLLWTLALIACGGLALGG